MNNQGKTISNQRKRCRLVLFPAPLQGHINPMIQLAHILHSRGFEISIIHTKYNSQNLSKCSEFNIHIIPDGLSESEASSIADITLLLRLMNTNCVKPLHDCLAELLLSEKNKVNPVVGIITDSSWYFTRPVADSLNLPRIVLRSTSVCSLLAFASLPLLQEKGYFNKLDSKREELVPELPPLKVKDIPVIESSEDVHQLVQKVVTETKKGSGLIFNTFKELEQPQLFQLKEAFLMPTFAIGPFHKLFSAASTSLLTQDRSCISWLDAQASKSVLYISFGSLAAMDIQKTNEVALGLANSMQPFLWVVRPGLVHSSEWIEILPKEFLEKTSKRGHIVKWAPQQEVLAHPAIGGFWTHCGWNSTLESICEGVPMICSPFFGDQMVNSRYVNDVWRIGIKLEKGIDSVEIEEAIRRLMVDREGDEMRQRVMYLKEKADVCLNSGGSSYRALDSLVDFICASKSFA